MKRLSLAFFLVVGSVLAQGPQVTPLLAKNLADIPGKEATMFTVEYAPGSEGTVHRHNAHVFVYVLEGSIVMQVRGGKEVTLGRVEHSMKDLWMFTRSAGTRAKHDPLHS